MHTPFVQIRRAALTDAAMLATFAARTFHETYAAENEPAHMTEHLESAYGLEQQSRELTDPSYITVIAESEAALAGYAQLRRGTPPTCIASTTTVELYRFYVDRPWHGHGLAQNLMLAAHAAAAELEGTHVWLGVWEHNLRARAFYAKVGFVDVGATNFFVGPDRQTDRVLVMPIANSR